MSMRRPYIRLPAETAGRARCQRDSAGRPGNRKTRQRHKVNNTARGFRIITGPAPFVNIHQPCMMRGYMPMPDVFNPRFRFCFPVSLKNEM